VGIKIIGRIFGASCVLITKVDFWYKSFGGADIDTFAFVGTFRNVKLLSTYAPVDIYVLFAKGSNYISIYALPSFRVTTNGHGRSVAEDKGHSA
jgi:hypothetical protein